MSFQRDASSRDQPNATDSTHARTDSDHAPTDSDHTSADSDHAPTDSDHARPAICDRCDDPIREDRVIHISSEPCAELADRYRPTTETYCPDCVAAIGMLAFVVDTNSPPGTEVSRQGTR
ncbi:hypothetical protein AB7C87_21850 [Natrarchaeobius sp. A-rgal3]|uniref:hypothetical protein n=1 Tax=Natrarchaeobius versutus TaxID=1679078 RepID=UPI003510817C